MLWHPTKSICYKNDNHDKQASKLHHRIISVCTFTTIMRVNIFTHLDNNENKDRGKSIFAFNLWINSK